MSFGKQSGLIASNSNCFHLCVVCLSTLTCVEITVLLSPIDNSRQEVSETPEFSDNVGRRNSWLSCNPVCGPMNSRVFGPEQSRRVSEGHSSSSIMQSL